MPIQSAEVNMFEVFTADSRYGIYMTEQIAASTARRCSEGNKSAEVVTDRERMIYIDGMLVKIEKR
jgi:hypothetical protein